MGPTGCGKTEIARRLAKLDRAPFIKVEATKFTEVGYVGRDVDSIVRDLVEASVKLVREEALADVKERAREAAEECLLDALLPRPKPKAAPGFFTGGVPLDATSSSSSATAAPGDDKTRERFRQMLRSGELEDREVDVDVAQQAPSMQVLGPPGMDGAMGDQLSGLQDALASAFGGKKKQLKLKIKDARPILERDEGTRMLDQDALTREAVRRAEESGIVFIDEIDKIAGGDRRGADVSREGVQRDILPIIEGSTVSTKHGPVKTDHVLFICAGAFHMSKPSDLIPELQGRLPIRVELQPLTKDDFVRILKDTETSLVRQYQALLATDGVTVTFADDGLEAVADIAATVNMAQENIGARRLATVLEQLLEDESFNAPDRAGRAVHVDGALVRTKLSHLLSREDLTRYIL